ncbi:MAG TPA: UDP-N-acetylmuramoyl-L-alanyl-D-glutamate--2,6-diaminopimelate ligase [Myxococcota bacterium]|nr:UDP-N-acetylmuramoyl-L-alanyl-D-glutamate--2,6-diaminopimelate ligase [Myxococcota bacterium]
MTRIQERLLKDMGVIAIHGDVASVHIDRVSCDSRTAGPGCAWVAIPGTRVDGHTFINSAVAAGASLIVCERMPESSSLQTPPFVVVEDSRVALAFLASAVNGDPTGSIDLFAAVGTDGKSSTTMIVEAGLQGCGFAAGLLGTLVYRYPGRTLESSLTTPDPVTLQEFFRDMLAAGIRHAVMEVSSHAIHQRRVESCLFKSAVFTNLTRDHLDYHGTIEAYREAKVRFFTEVLPRNPSATGVVVNDDDEVADEIRRRCPLKVIGWTMQGRESSEVRLIDVDYSLDGTRFSFQTPWGLIKIESPLIGRHNVANIMSAVSLAGLNGLDLKAFVAGVQSLAVIPGRLERVKSSSGIRVFVDYAHTPKAIESVLAILRPMVKDGDLHIVFGAGGDRDSGKRPLMGRAAVIGARYATICSDNPRSEPEESILEAIVSGVREAEQEGVARASWQVIADRRTAIMTAIRQSKPGDVVLIAGKGHEQVQKFKDHTVHFSDVEVASEALGE